MRSFIKGCLYLLALVFISHSPSWSQSAANVGLSMSIGNEGFNTNARRGLGGSVEYLCKLWKRGGVRAYTAFDWFNHRQPKNIDARVLADSILKFPEVFSDKSIIPLRVGCQQFFYKDAAFVYGDAGVARWMTYGDNNGKYVFSYALGTGYSMRFTEERHIQFSFFYNQNLGVGYAYSGRKRRSSSDYFSFRAAYGLGLRKKGS